MVSSHATSWEHCGSTGCIDKTPVCNQNLPEAERHELRNAVLPWPCVHLCTTHQEPVTFCRLGVATVSLWRLSPAPNRIVGALVVAHTRVPSDQCPRYSTNVRGMQRVPPAGGLSFLPMPGRQGPPERNDGEADSASALDGKPRFLPAYQRRLSAIIHRPRSPSHHRILSGGLIFHVLYFSTVPY